MTEEVNLVKDLALILISAGVFTIISKALKQPLILGYIVAGFIVGPHLGLFPSVTNMETVNQWSEIGIIFLLFALGLEFSFKKLIKVGSSALITAGTKCIGMFLVGLVAGQILHFTTMESIFLGGLLSMSSTTIIIKAYDEMGLKNKPYSTLIFGSLVFEDLIAILLMVLLSTLAVSNKFAGTEMIQGIAKLVFFIILWFLVGIFVIPSLLKLAKKYLSDEILLITAIGLCFGMVVVAELVGFSSALGAFVMGSILAETLEGERIEHLLGGIKDLFGAIFFVSVGMMVDPAVIGSQWLPILVITICAMIGILIFSTSGALIAGQGLDTAVHAGFSLSQLGEFAFIIAGLGCSLGVMRDFIYPVVIAVSVITTFTTPYMIKAADPVSRWLYKVLPDKFLAKINPAPEDKNRSQAEKSVWKSLLKTFFLRVFLYGILLVAVLLGTDFFLPQMIGRVWPGISENAADVIEMLITLGIMIPFLLGLVVTRGSMVENEARLIKEKAANKWPIMSLGLLRVLIGLVFVVVAITSHVELSSWSLFIVVALVLLIFFIVRRSFNNVSGLEDRFFENLNEKETREKEQNPLSAHLQEMLSGYDLHLETITISPDSDLIGHPLRQLPLRKTHNLNILKIERGSKSIEIPSGDEIIYPFDRITVAGTSEFLSQFKAELDKENIAPEEPESSEFTVVKTVLRSDSFLRGKTLREAKINQSGCMVISLLRGDRFITTPKADEQFKEGDIVWIAGEKKSCEWYK